MKAAGPGRGAAVLLLLLMLARPAPAAGRLSLGIEAAALFPAGDIYRQVYGRSVYYPQLRLRLAVAGGLGLWAGYGYLDARGATIGLGQPIRLHEDVGSLGLDFSARLGKGLAFLAGAGYAYINYRESAGGDEARSHCQGLLAEASLRLRLSRRLGWVLRAGYLKADENPATRPSPSAEPSPPAASSSGSRRCIRSATSPHPARPLIAASETGTDSGIRPCGFLPSAAHRKPSAVYPLLHSFSTSR